jgi:hypothetical protein
MPSLPNKQIPRLVADSHHLSNRRLASKYGIGPTQVAEILRAEEDDHRWVCKLCPNKFYKHRTGLSHHKKVRHHTQKWNGCLWSHITRRNSTPSAAVTLPLEGAATCVKSKATESSLDTTPANEAVNSPGADDEVSLMSQHLVRHCNYYREIFAYVKISFTARD